MNLDGSNLFPARFLGFGFFWAWLFLVGITPSPLLGSLVCFGNIPFEMAELLARSVLLIPTILFSVKIATIAGKRILLAVGSIAGTLAVLLALSSSDPLTSTIAAILVAAAEISMFLMWLSFFGYMKLGDTIMLLVMSYAAGSILCLVIIGAGHAVMVAGSILLPLASCATFLLSNKFVTAQSGTSLFSPANMSDIPRTHLPITRPLTKATIGLGLYSFLFALYVGTTTLMTQDFTRGYLIEPACIIAFAGVYAAFAFLSKDPSKPYVFYRFVPPIMGAGFAMLATGAAHPILEGACITFAYITFEMLALNDYCNIVKMNDASLLKTMAIARLAISVGMLLGWSVGYIAEPLITVNPDAIEILAVAGLFIALLTATLVFTEKDRSVMGIVADDRAIAEESDKGPNKNESMQKFIKDKELSKRESEVLEYLLAGRTTTYAAEKLFVAESTVRAHVHNIYHKVDVHSRMELMDAFDEYWLAHDVNSDKQNQ